MSDSHIKHVVVLGLENRSFDQMLGCFKEKYPKLEGIDPHNPHENFDQAGTPYRQEPTEVRQIPSEKAYLWDPRHEVPHVRTQITGEKTLADGRRIKLPGKMSGFVLDYATEYPDSTPEARRYIMGYYKRGFLPALHALAENFTICDHWFSSLPGPTWPNRFFALSGTSRGHVDMPDDEVHHSDVLGYFHQTQPTIFDRLSDKGVTWKVYFSGIPQSWVMTRPRMPHNVARYFYFDEFFDDTRGPEESFPQFCFIEPDYLGFQENDDHPPHDIMKAEKLIADVYNAIRANRKLWESMLLIVFFDEHGGYYDHVEPPAAPAPDAFKAKEFNFDFTQFGVRVPALLVSPWVRQDVLSTEFDHTSILKYLIEKWGLDDLGNRARAANSIAAAITDSMREVALTHIELTPEQLRPVDPDIEDAAFGISAHHTALQKFATYLRVKLWVFPTTVAIEEAPVLYANVARIVEGAVLTVALTVKGLAHKVAQARGRRAQPVVSIGEPDKVHTDSAPARTNVAKFLKHGKERALETLPDSVRAGHPAAAYTLAVMTGRPLRTHEHARVWLEKHGK
jgi:phospholipase C